MVIKSGNKHEHMKFLYRAHKYHHYSTGNRTQILRNEYFILKHKMIILVSFNRCLHFDQLCTVALYSLMCVL